MSKIYGTLKKYLDYWRMGTPEQKWQIIYNLGSFLSELTGITIYTDMQNYWYSYSTEVVAIIYFITATYTVCYHFERQEYLRGLQATCGIGLLVSCALVQIQTLRPIRYKLHYLMNFGGKFVYGRHDQRPKFRLVRERMISKFIRHLSILVIMLIVTVAMLGMQSVYLILFKGVRITFLGTELPFFDKDSDIGFWLNIFFQVFIATLAGIGCCSIELGTSLITNGISAFPYMIRVDLEELGLTLELDGIALDRKAQLRNVFMKIQDYERLVRDLIEVSYMRLFVGPFLFTYSISFSIFGQLILGYPSGYGIAFANYLLLQIFCQIGESVEQTKRGIETELYNVQWYLLPVESQKQLCRAIHMIQNGRVLTIGPFSKLNMETATKLTIIIYRVTMLLCKVIS